MNNRKQSSRNNMNGRNRQSRNNNGNSQNSHTQRMTFKQSIDKYTALSKEASSLGDTITAEHYRQYAEHYRREYNDWLSGNQHLFEKQRVSSDSIQPSSQEVSISDMEIDVSYLSISPESMTLQENSKVSYNAVAENRDENKGEALAETTAVKSPKRGRKPKPKVSSE